MCFGRFFCDIGQVNIIVFGQVKVEGHLPGGKRYQNLKGKLGYKFTTCYLDCISYNLPTDKKLTEEKVSKK